MKFESFCFRLSIPAFIQMWAISGHFAHFAQSAHYVYHLFLPPGIGLTSTWLSEKRGKVFYYHNFTSSIKNDLNDFNEILIEDWCCRLEGWDMQCEILLWHHNRDPLKQRYKGRHYSKLLYSSGLWGKSSSKKCWGRRSIVSSTGFHANEKMLSCVS